MNFSEAREKMVDCQVRPNDVTDHGVLRQFLQVPRERFVPEERRSLSYIDDDMAVVSTGGDARYLMNPMPFSKLVQLAQVKETDFVLDIGCATGYSSAIFSGLAESVVAVESHVDLQEQASEILQELGYDNVAVISAPLTEGCPSEAPFDVIFVGGAVEQVPDSLFQQLKEGGRLIAVLGQGNTGQATVFQKTADAISSHVAFNSNVRPLPGFEKAQEFVF